MKPLKSNLRVKPPPPLEWSKIEKIFEKKFLVSTCRSRSDGHKEVLHRYLSSVRTWITVRQNVNMVFWACLKCHFLVQSTCINFGYQKAATKKLFFLKWVFFFDLFNKKKLKFKNEGKFTIFLWFCSENFFEKIPKNCHFWDIVG